MSSYQFPPIKQGNTLQPPTMQYSDETAGQPIPLTGYRIKAVLTNPTNKKIVAQWDTAAPLSNIDMTQAASGIFRLGNWDANIPPGAYIGDIDFEANGIKDTFCNIELQVVNAY